MSKTPEPLLQNGRRIGFIEACWHHDIVEQARLAFIADLDAAGLSAGEIDVVKVPGSLEIPLQCQKMAKSGKYQLLVAAGLIVDGGIYRHDFVASAVLDGIMQVQLSTEVPILSVVLTPHNFNQQKHHHDFFHSHFRIKGSEAAAACLQTLEIQALGIGRPENIAA